MEDIVNWERRKGVDNSKQLCLIFAFQKKKKKLCLIFSTVDYITVLLFRKQCVTDKTLCLLWGGWLELYLFDEVWVSYSSVKMWGSDLFFLQMQIVVCGGFLFLEPIVLCLCLSQGENWQVSLNAILGFMRSMIIWRYLLLLFGGERTINFYMKSWKHNENVRRSIEVYWIYLAFYVVEEPDSILW